MKWNDVSFLLGSSLSKKILECLNDSKEPLAPLQISKKTDIAKSNVSTKLGALTKRGLVEPIDPEVRKWRFYRITKKGKDVLREVKKVRE